MEDGKIRSPVITWMGNGPSIFTFYHTYYNSEAITRAFIIDSRLNIDFYALFRNGELFIIYLLKEDALVAHQPVIKCDIIDTKNELKSHESDVYYLHRPTITRHVVVDTTWDSYKECYLLQFNIDKNYTIPINQEFRFHENCFANKWMLTWEKEKLDGMNVHCHLNGEIINDLNKKCSTGNESLVIYRRET